MYPKSTTSDIELETGTEGGCLLRRRQTGQSWQLDRIATAVWQLADGSRAPRELVEGVLVQLPDVTGNDVWTAMDHLADDGLMSRAVPPTASATSSRRRFMVGAAAMALGAVAYVSGTAAPVAATAEQAGKRQAGERPTAGKEEGQKLQTGDRRSASLGEANEKRQAGERQAASAEQQGKRQAGERHAAGREEVAKSQAWERPSAPEEEMQKLYLRSGEVYTVSDTPDSSGDLARKH